MPHFILIKRSLKHRHACEGDPVYRTPHSEASVNEPPDLSSRPDGSLLGPDSSLASITAELRLGGVRSPRFIHEATGVNLTSCVVAELLEEYGKPVVSSSSTRSRPL